VIDVQQPETSADSPDVPGLKKEDVSGRCEIMSSAFRASAEVSPSVAKAAITDERSYGSFCRTVPAGGREGRTASATFENGDAQSRWKLLAARKSGAPY